MDCSLFCPTVGPILSGGMPGVGLYSVLIFSSIVCRQSSHSGTHRLACLLSATSERLVDARCLAR